MLRRDAEGAPVDDRERRCAGARHTRRRGAHRPADPSRGQRRRRRPSDGQRRNPLVAASGLVLVVAGRRRRPLAGGALHPVARTGHAGRRARAAGAASSRATSARCWRPRATRARRRGAPGRRGPDGRPRRAGRRGRLRVIDAPGLARPGGRGRGRGLAPSTRSMRSDELGRQRYFGQCGASSACAPTTVCTAETCSRGEEGR